MSPKMDRRVIRIQSAILKLVLRMIGLDAVIIGVTLEEDLVCVLPEKHLILNNTFKKNFVVHEFIQRSGK